MLTPSNPIEALDVRFFEPPHEVTVRVTGLDPALAAVASDHWAAAIAPFDPTCPIARPVLAIERSDRRRRRRPQRSTAGSTDVLSLPGGQLLVHPDREVVEVSLRDVSAADGYLLLDVLDAGLALSLARRQVLLLHGAAFGHAAGNVLAVGGSGSGKSTLAAAAIAGGARVVSDDTVLVRTTAGRLEAWPFRNHLGFRRDPEAMLPGPSADQVARLDGDEWTWWRLDLAALPPRSRARSVEPSRVWILSVDRRLNHSRCIRLSQSECLAGLLSAASPLVLSPRYRRTRTGLLPLLRGLAEGCQGWRVRLGAALVGDPAAELERLLALTS